MIELKNVTKTYPNGTRALHNVDLKIDDGEFVFIVGPNGAGKTTLIKLLSREELPTSGQIEVNGYNVEKIKKRKIPYLRRTLGVVFQDFRLFPNMTVFGNIAFAMHIIGEPNRKIKKRVHSFLKLVDLEGRETHYPSQLSGGEQRRVALARALVTNPDTIIADEPTSNSDTVTASNMMRLLRYLNESLGKTVIVITHDINTVNLYVNEYNKRVITISDGAIASDVRGGERS